MVAEGRMRVVTMRVSSLTSLLGMNSARGKKITVATVVSFLQGLTDNQIDQIHKEMFAAYRGGTKGGYRRSILASAGYRA